MKAVKFLYENILIAKDQPQYNTLPALMLPGKEGQMITCWELSEEELEQVKKTRKIYLSTSTFKEDFQPVRLETDLSEFITLIREGDDGSKA